MTSRRGGGIRAAVGLGFGSPVQDLLGVDVRQPLQGSAARSRGELFVYTTKQCDLSGRGERPLSVVLRPLRSGGRVSAPGRNRPIRSLTASVRKARVPAAADPNGQRRLRTQSGLSRSALSAARPAPHPNVAQAIDARRI